MICSRLPLVFLGGQCGGSACIFFNILSSSWAQTKLPSKHIPICPTSSHLFILFSSVFSFYFQPLPIMSHLFRTFGEQSMFETISTSKWDIFLKCQGLRCKQVKHISDSNLSYEVFLQTWRKAPMALYIPYFNMVFSSREQKCNFCTVNT